MPTKALGGATSRIDEEGHWSRVRQIVAARSPDRGGHLGCPQGQRRSSGAARDGPRRGCCHRSRVRVVTGQREATGHRLLLAATSTEVLVGLRTLAGGRTDRSPTNPQSCRRAVPARRASDPRTRPHRTGPRPVCRGRPRRARPAPRQPGPPHPGSRTPRLPVNGRQARPPRRAPLGVRRHGHQRQRRPADAALRSALRVAQYTLSL